MAEQESEKPFLNSEESVEVLLDEKTNKFSLRLEIHKNGMECLASIPLAPAKIIKPKQLEKILRKSGIKGKIDPQKVVNFCTQIQAGTPVANFKLVEGCPPGPGKNGWLELNVRTSSDEPEYQEDEKGNIDFRTLNFFGYVEPGEEIGRVQPPEPGPSGMTVTGGIIPAPIGKPLSLYAGEGVRLEDGGHRVIVEMAGRVIYDGSHISISEQYLVGGDVDLSIGHIDFNGFVEIKGDVLDEFDIRAKKGLKINGNVGISQIESEGDVFLGGMAGQGKGQIKCGGNLVARYLNDVLVECDGNVVVQNEIRNCHIKSNGNILVSKGVILGGECIALGGIEAKRIGNPCGARTRLTAGVDFRRQENQKKLHVHLKDVEKRIASITNILEPTSQSEENTDSLPVKIKQLLEKLKDLQSVKTELRAELDALKEKETRDGRAKINVGSLLFEGTVINLGETTEELKTEINGAFSIVENIKERTFRYLSHSPLSQKVTENEEELEEPDDS